MIHEDGSGFMEAFTEAVRPGEARLRQARWLLVIGAAALFTVALGALLNGAISSGSGSGTTTGAAGLATGPLGLGTSLAVPGAAPSTAQPPWAEVAGPSCDNAGATFSETGFFNSGTGNPKADWSSAQVGGDGSDGCSGSFDSMPLSGRTSAYDSNRYAVWTFAPGADYQNASCSTAVFVPNVSALPSVGGNPAHYFYYGASYATAPSTAPLGGFTVDQPAHLGHWVPGPTFEITTGTVSIRLVDAGLNTGPAHAAARDAVAQIRLSCKAAG